MKKACFLCQDVKLSIIREPDEKGGEQLHITVQDEWTLCEAELIYPLTQNEFGLVSQYHVREGLVIGLRRLVDEAIKEKVIRISSKK